MSPPPVVYTVYWYFQAQGLGAKFLIAEFYLVDRGLRHRLPGFSSILFRRQGAEAPAAGILEFRPPGCPPVGSPQVPVPMGTLR